MVFKEICFFILYAIRFWNLYKVAAGCDVESLSLPENGQAWTYNPDKKRWELECKINYEIERGLFYYRNTALVET